jgi:hypothetical protein
VRRASTASVALIASALALALATVVLLGCGDGGGDEGGSQRDGSARWSVFEDHNALVRSGAERREATLRELKDLGADTLRIGLRWNEVAPFPLSRVRPGFDAGDPNAYPGFAPYDELIRAATKMGFRILVDLAPDAPRWATEGGRGKPPGNVNARPIPAEFGRFAEAVAKRYSGHFQRLPEVGWFSLWNEPNHQLFLKPLREAPTLYRHMVEAALPALREFAAGDAKVLVGETAPSGRAGASMGPAEFIRKWLCLDARFQPIGGGDCEAFEKVDADGFAHHPYGPVDTVPPGRDIVNLLAIRRLGRYLDLAAKAGRIPDQLPIYNTEFGLQSNPPDPTVSTTLAEQASQLNQKEELSYRYPRLRSYAQYLLYDDPIRPGPTAVAWSGFQTGLRFADGRKKPAWNAYMLPIVVHRTAMGVRIWGRVRPGEGRRTIQLERRVGRRFTTEGKRVGTDADGCFELSGTTLAAYRFVGYDGGGRRVGTSRLATPLP